MFLMMMSPNHKFLVNNILIILVPQKDDFFLRNHIKAGDEYSVDTCMEMTKKFSQQISFRFDRSQENIS